MHLFFYQRRNDLARYLAALEERPASIYTLLALQSALADMAAHAVGDQIWEKRMRGIQGELAALPLGSKELFKRTEARAGCARVLLKLYGWGPYSGDENPVPEKPAPPQAPPPPAPVVRPSAGKAPEETSSSPRPAVSTIRIHLEVKTPKAIASPQPDIDESSP